MVCVRHAGGVVPPAGAVELGPVVRHAPAGPVRFGPRTEAGRGASTPAAYSSCVPEIIESPSRVEAAGTKPKLIDEFVGRVNTGEERLSVARMQSPEGWEEPGQRPDFDEYTLVIDGALRVEHEGGTIDVRAGQAVLVRAGEWVRYATPEAGGAHYVAICLPAFSPDTVHRDED